MNFAKLDDSVFRMILSWLPESECFGTVAGVSKIFSSIVWRPDFHQNLVLDFTATKKRPCLCVELLTARGSAVMFGSIWSQARRVEIIFHEEYDTELMQALQATNSIEELRIVNASSEFLFSLFQPNFVFPNLVSLTIEQVKCESILSLFEVSPFARFPQMTEFVLNEVFFIRVLEDLGSVASSCGSTDFELLDERQLLIEKIDLYLIPFTQVVEFVGEYFHSSFPNLKILKFKCLSSARDSQLLAAVLGQTVASLPALEEFEVGVLTPSLLHFLKRVGSSFSLRKLIIPSRLCVPGDKLHKFLADCVNLEEIKIRLGSSSQVDEMSEALVDLDGGLKSIEIQWNTVNAISVHSLVRLRASLHSFNQFHVSVRSLEASCSESGSSSSRFEKFYEEICRDRIVCECTECENGCNEEHVLELAREEWDELNEVNRQVFNRL